MKFIQLAKNPLATIYDFDGYCFGLEVSDPHGRGQPLHRLRPHRKSPQNGGIGWYTMHFFKLSFKLEITL